MQSRTYLPYVTGVREALRLSESRYRRLFESAQDGILLLNADTAQIEDVNPYLIRMLGYSHPELLGKKLWEVGLFSDITLSKEMFSALQINGYVRYEDLPLKTKAGVSIQVEFISNSYDCEGIKVIQCNIRDISQRKALDVKIQRQTQLYAALSECNKAIIYGADREELFLTACRAAVDFGGMKMAFIALIDENTRELRLVTSFGGGAVEPEDLETPQSADTQYGYGPIGMAIWEERPYWYQDFVDDPISVPWQMCGDEGGWIASASLPLFHNQVVTGVFVLYSGEINAFDESARNLLTEIAANISFALDNFTRESLRKKAEEEIEHLAFYDALTSLPNRRLLHRRLQQRLNTTSSQYAAVLMLDLDNFKHLNDTMGHHIGDLLLIEVAVRLHACVQAGDTVARLGGDEFIVILAELDEAAEKALIQADAIGNKILAALCQPYLLKGSEYRGSTSIGISLFNSHELTETELLKRTDTAMYQAKNAGGNTKRFYDPAMQATLDVRLSLARDLHCALAEKQLSLYYQGQVDQTGHVLGAEALLRWRHPEYGLVSPRMFIPLAEEKGMIMSIGHWVLETACVQLKAWEADPLLCDLKLAVNVSARQFYQSDFVEQVLALITTTGIDPNKLKLELTESVVMDDIDSTIVKMHALRQNGVSFSLDDFGTGYSSLSYLTLLPVDQLKIDQSFVHNIGVKDSDAIIVQTIIGMAHNLGMEVFAEGVETEGQRTFLERHGCGFYQGYLFSKPLPVQEFETLFLH